MVILNPGQLHVGKTKTDGVYTFSHSCKIGQTLKAEPEDAAKYYNSEEQVCAKVVVLEVFPRPQKIGLADFFHIQEVNTPPGAHEGKVYAGVFAFMMDKVEPVTGGDKEKCKLTINKKFRVAYYNTKMTDWEPVADTAYQISAKDDGNVFTTFRAPARTRGSKSAKLRNKLISI